MSQDRSGHCTSSTPFLTCSDPPDCNLAKVKEKSRPKMITYLYVFIVYTPAIILFVFSYLRCSYLKCNLSHYSPSAGGMPSPVSKSNAIGFEMVHFPQDFQHSKYAGEPNSELDTAWHLLLEGSNIRVDEEDLDVLGLTSIAVSNGGYVSQLGVFHELHCLKRIRQWIFKDYYVFSKNLTEAELQEWPAHVNHCIEMLRQSLMCKGDTSLLTFKWIGSVGHRFPTIWDQGPHYCTKWDSLVSWTKNRAVDISTPGTLIDESGELYP